MSVRWTHVTLTVSDFERALAFYTTTCDLAVLRDRRREGGGTVWLGPRPAPGEPPTFLLVLGEGEVTSRIDHLGFQCESRAEVDARAAEAERRGTLVEPPTDFGGAVGYTTLVSDPDGHLIEFTYGQPVKGLD